MTKLLKKIYCIIFILIFVLELFFPITLYAVSYKFDKYLALGDSIAYGYGLPNRNSQSYSQIVRSKLNISSSNFKNLAISGMTCKEFYEKITTDTSYQSAIKSSDLITVSIGSNEVLGLAINAVANITGVNANDSNFEFKVKQAFMNANYIQKLSMLQQIYDFFTSNETKKKINASINTYSEYWKKSHEYINSLNSNVTLVATQFYNPYYEVSLLNYDFGGFADEPIVKMNKILEEQSNSEKNYKIAKIYNDFNTTNPRLTNVNINILENNYSFDPHPNISGHQKIAARVIDALSTVTAKKNISTLSISSIKDYTYTGSEIKPSITIKDGTKTLVENTDYTTIYSNNTNVGQAKVNITGIGNYSGKVIKTFNIVEKPRIDISKMSIDKVNDQTYTGIKITPLIEIKNGSSVLVKDKDYLLTYQNNINVGSAKIIVTGIGNYSGTTNQTFNIVPKSISNVTISNIEKQSYTGNAIIPSVLLSDGSSKLQPDKDYVITYSNNINVGNALITIQGINNYTGQTTKTFEIVDNNTNTSKNISDTTCTEIEDKIYTGKSITPEVILTDGQYTLVKGTDYTLSYNNNLNVGIGLLTIKGLGIYTGEITKDFNIVRKNIEFTLIDDIADQLYTGKEIIPNLTITSDYVKLSEGQDYSLNYSNNIEEGTATIIITGINNYTGTTIKTFNIVKPSSGSPDSTNDNPIKSNTDDASSKAETLDVQNTNISAKESNSSAPDKLPYTGIRSIVLVIFPLLSIVIFVIYKKLKYLNY